MKKYLLSILFAAVVLLVPAAADLFPVESIAADGFTNWGYMNEEGEQVIPFQYASASAFGENGLATVTDSTGCMAVIDESGQAVVSFRTAPDTVEFSDGVIAYRYDGYSVYFDEQGNELGTIQGASGFFSEAEGLMPVQGADGLWGYISKGGVQAIAAQYTKAGAFSGGYAVVGLAEGGYAVIDTAGNQTPLPNGVTPRYMEVFGGQTVVLSNGSRLALYSLRAGAERAPDAALNAAQNASQDAEDAQDSAEEPSGGYLTDFIYQELSAFDEGYALARLNNRWGILDLNGNQAVAFQYNYLSYMGQGVYAARADDGSVAAIDTTGALIYRTYVYAGGFDTISHGVAWHGTMDNGIIFFSKVGGYITKLANAEKPVVLTDDVVLVTIGSKRQYIRLHDNQVLYYPERSYDLGYCKISTTSYEKYLGTDKNGQEYGWYLTYPVVSGLSDKTVQSKVNSAIEGFFLAGPSSTAQRQALTGTYGVRLTGRLLVVWADCISGSGDGATAWNDNITIDLATGTTYSLVRDLFTKDYATLVSSLLPEDLPFYLVGYPRLTDGGITFYYNAPQDSSKGQRAPSTTAYTFTLSQLDTVLRKDSECYKALNGNAIGTLDQYTGYEDVPESHWAYGAIRAVSLAELMVGDGAKFEPETPITGAEIAAVMVRALEIDTSSIAAPAGAPWYYIEATAAQDAGLMDGLGSPLPYASVMNRADAMQVLANALLRRGEAALTESEITAQLSAFSDAADVPENRRAAVALCVRTGLVVGSGGKLNPGETFTRAQFAQILSLMIAE